MNPSLTAPLEGDQLTKDMEQDQTQDDRSRSIPARSLTDTDWLTLSRQAYESSTSYYQTYLQPQWVRNIANFKSRHPPNSKYYTESYKYRSNLFRPKTRSTIRALESASATALFSSSDIISIQAQDDTDPRNVWAAKFMQELVNWRLTNSIPWFTTCLAGVQDALVHGCVISHQYWEYAEQTQVVKKPMMDPLSGLPILGPDGTPVVLDTIEKTVVKDTPRIVLIPPENIRISSAADSMDALNSSPYLIHLLPMFVCDVMERMGKGKNRKTGEPDWRQVSKAVLARAVQSNSTDLSGTRRARESAQRDPTAAQFEEISDYQITWIHKNIIRRQGKDWLYYTVGPAEALLSDPVPLEDVYLHAEKERPYVMGIAIIEAHRTHPAALVELEQDLQAEANDTANQRIDNVRLAMNKRYFVREGRRVDVQSLLRNVPGSVTMMVDPEADVKIVSTPDITASAYQEQDRINVDFDELAGQFSTGSVQTNRKLNETATGMQLMESSAGQVAGYTLMTLVKTWIEPLLRQMVRMEQKYETDEVAMAVAGAKANIQEMDAALFDYNLNVTVNVSMGSVTPMQKLQRFVGGLQSLAQLMPDLPMTLNKEEVIKEVFGQLGYQDGARFFQAQQPGQPGQPAPGQPQQPGQPGTPDQQQSMEPPPPTLADQAKAIDAQTRQQDVQRQALADQMTYHATLTKAQQEHERTLAQLELDHRRLAHDQAKAQAEVQLEQQAEAQAQAPAPAQAQAQAEAQNRLIPSASWYGT